MEKKIQITSLKIKQPPILSPDPTQNVECELWLTFKVNEPEYKTVFLARCNPYKKEVYWDNEMLMEADYDELIKNFPGDTLTFTFRYRKEGVTHNEDWLVYKPKFDTFVYHRWFTWNTITQAAIYEIRLLGEGINNHRYITSSAFMSCLETLNAWST